jgi:choline monooxygenase
VPRLLVSHPSINSIDMFIHQNRLEHLLTPAQYFSPQQHQLELERLFLPSWHLLATKAEMPNDGDFITLDLFGRPLLLRNFEGDIRAFLNVCAHRHCLLTHRPRGNDSRFRCQYHGWEYNKEGRAARIPDARCFRPWDRENARLKTYRTETCGELIFVCLQDDGPSLAEYLGPYHSYCAENYTAPFRHYWTWDSHYDSNWKILIENSLETYHVPYLHRKTFRNSPAEEKCEHELSERYTWFKMRDDSAAVRFQGWYVRQLGMPSTCHYAQHHLHPHMTLASMDAYHAVQVVFPTSATTCHHKLWLFTARGDNPGPVRRALGTLLAPVITVIARQVIIEDKAIYSDVQRGLDASTFRGALGIREERVYVFQKYVLDRCGLSILERAAGG